MELHNKVAEGIVINVIIIPFWFIVNWIVSLMQEGRAILCGDEESVYKQFQEDNRQVKFSKDRAVKMVIQLVTNR